MEILSSVNYFDGFNISQSSIDSSTNHREIILLLTTRLCDFAVANSVLKKKQTFSNVPLTVKPLCDKTETANTQEVSLQCFLIPCMNKGEKFLK